MYNNYYLTTNLFHTNNIQIIQMILRAAFLRLVSVEKTNISDETYFSIDYIIELSQTIGLRLLSKMLITSRMLIYITSRMFLLFL